MKLSIANTIWSLAFAAAFLLLDGMPLGAQPAREKRAGSRSAPTPAASPKVYSPLEFGARPDGATLATAAIQRAIDQCAGKGGGIVQLSRGVYLSGTIFLRTGVTLQIDEGATLLGSTRLADYPEVTPTFQSLMTERELVKQSIIYAERVERIGIRGKGVIDGQGAKFTVQPKVRPLVARPFIIRMVECREVLVEDITLLNSASWTESYLACDNLTIRNIRIYGHAIRNNDGIDIDGCQNVLIEGVESSSDDDGMCFKGTSDRPTRNVVVRNSRFYSYCNALKIGTDSQGAFENLRLENLELGRPPPGTPPLHLGRPEGVSGVSLEIVDGGTIDGVVIDNVKVVGTMAPIYIVLGDRGRHLKDKPRPPPGVVKNITISNLTAETASPMGCPIIGLSNHRIEKLLLRNIKISFPGGGTTEDRARKFTEKADTYPEAIKYAKHLPAFGLFFWHAANVRLENVSLTTRATDQREAIVLEDVDNFTIDGRMMRGN
jgi:polygalacturonase